MLTYHRLKSEKPPLYDYEPWNITEKEFKLENNHHNETIFSLGNGYMGLRGTLEEDFTGPSNKTTPGFYINGIYEEEEIIYGEYAPKQPKKCQSIINLMDWTKVNLFIGQEKFDLIEGKIDNYKRTLDFKNGLLKRSLVWTTEHNKKVKINIERIISFENEHVGAIKYSITPLNFDGNLKIVSSFSGNVRNHHHLRNKKSLFLKQKGIENSCPYLLMETNNSNISVGGCIFNNIEGVKDEYITLNKVINKEEIKEEFNINGIEGEEYTLEKFAAFYTSRDVDQDKILDNCFREISKINGKGFEYLKRKQQEYLEEYWKYSDVKIEGDLGLQQAFRYNALQILQSTGKNGKTNIAAKGLTGEYYEGHYFWDTETYIIPFFNYSHPEIARELLNFRYKILDEARNNAGRMKLDGALFPWRTINGKEASGNFLGSTVQYHINADIAFAINKYINATEDYEFLYNKGAEILFETARMWVSLGHFEKLKDNKFCINEVCGPDEYKPAVNNNCYTNYMAKFNLEYAVNIYNKLKDEDSKRLNEILENIELSKEEIEEWKKAAGNMFLPYNENLGINPQDASFIYKEDIDIESIPTKELPLVQNWHPLTIWRYKILKQADVILLMLFMGDNFSLEQKRKNYDYYEPKTTHDSSLSPSIHSIMASEIGYYDDAYDYFIQTARLDLDDYNENAYQGLHTACMGSNWMVLVQGFAGMRNYNGKLRFDPYLPSQWDGYRFKIKYRGSLLEVHVREDFIEYELLEGKSIAFKHKEKEVFLNEDNDYLKTN